MKTAAPHEQNYSPEQAELAEHIIGLEKGALDKWFNGDVSGYRELWSRESFTYFDGDNPDRVEDHDTIGRFLDGLAGRLHADTYDFRNPRVQFGSDMALLTYQVYADTNLRRARSRIGRARRLSHTFISNGVTDERCCSGPVAVRGGQPVRPRRGGRILGRRLLPR
jgi:hypothetical protein